tara:strand:- start:495 stop:932 length:438 start_codon:yes stop_codon:yes gene_type:complete
MKRLLLLFIPLVFFFSCEKDNNTNCLLVGEAWTLNYIDFIDYGCALFCGTVEVEDCTDWYPDKEDLCLTIQFNADKTCVINITEDGETETNSGTWDSSCGVNNILSIYDENGGLSTSTEYYEILTLESNILEWRRPSGDIYVLTK